jgi:hypothetical protein
MWGALFDEKSGLYFAVFAGHRLRCESHGTDEYKHPLLYIVPGLC